MHRLSLKLSLDFYPIYENDYKIIRIPCRVLLLRVTCCGYFDFGARTLEVGSRNAEVRINEFYHLDQSPHEIEDHFFEDHKIRAGCSVGVLIFFFFPTSAFRLSNSLNLVILGIYL